MVVRSILAQMVNVWWQIYMRFSMPIRLLIGGRPNWFYYCNIQIVVTYELWSYLWIQLVG